MAKGTHATQPGAATERTKKQVGELWRKVGVPLAPPGILLLPTGIPFEVSIERASPPAQNNTFPLGFPAQSPSAMVRGPYTPHTLTAGCPPG